MKSNEFFLFIFQFSSTKCDVMHMYPVLLQPVHKSEVHAIVQLKVENSSINFFFGLLKNILYITSKSISTNRFVGVVKIVE